MFVVLYRTAKVIKVLAIMPHFDKNAIWQMAKKSTQQLFGTINCVISDTIVNDSKLCDQIVMVNEEHPTMGAVMQIYIVKNVVQGWWQSCNREEIGRFEVFTVSAPNKPTPVVPSKTTYDDVMTELKTKTAVNDS